jgi:hypothetical protein
MTMGLTMSIPGGEQAKASLRETKSRREALGFCSPRGLTGYSCNYLVISGKSKTPKAKGVAWSLQKLSSLSGTVTRHSLTPQHRWVWAGTVTVLLGTVKGSRDTRAAGSLIFSVTSMA